MPDKPAERPFVPSRSYDIEMRIRDKDYSNDLSRVRVVTSLDRNFINVILDIFVDPRDMILDSICGQDTIKLRIRYIGQSQPEVPKEQVDLNLVLFKLGFPIPQQQSIADTDQLDRVPISIITVPDIQLYSLYHVSNGVYFAKTVSEILDDLVLKASPNWTSTISSLFMDTEGLNSEIIDQVVVPPIPLSKAIGYLHNTFGFYEGAMGWTWQDNSLRVLNLAKRMNKNSTFIIYQLISAQDNSKVIEKCTDGKNFYTYEPIRSDYGANARFAAEAREIHHIVKPRDTLYGDILLELDTVCKDYGLISKRGTKIFYNPMLDGRVKYHVDHTGYDADNLFAIARVTEPVKDMSTVVFSLERNLRIINLMKVGEPVQLTVNTVESTDLGGKYILRSSDLMFNRSGEWQATATVRLMRTNRTL